MRWGFVLQLVIVTLNSGICKRPKKLVNEINQYDSSNIHSKIVGGKPVKIENYPSAAVLFNLGALCGATILNSWSVLSAAHCYAYNEDVEDMTVLVGAQNTHDFNAESFEVKDVKIHEDYNKERLFACDIAVAFLKKAIRFGKKAKKAVIVDTDKWMNEREKNFEVTGWGWTEYGGQVSDKGLLMAQLRYISSRECGKLHGITLSPDMFCLYGNGKKDACRGDSGSGVLWNGKLVGVVSHGDGCAQKNKPSIYSNVQYHTKWIKKTIARYFSKYCKV